MLEIKKKKETDNSFAKKDLNLPDSEKINTQDGLEELIKKNIQWSQIIYEQNKKIKRRITFMVVGSYLRLALFFIPLILGIIYLPVLLGNVWGEYSSLLGVQPESLLDGSVIDQNQIKAFVDQFSGGQNLQQLLKNQK